MSSPPFNTLEEWLRWQETGHSKAIDLGLDRVRAVAERMQLLSPTATVITVAGTNGKGSCVATVYNSLLALGYKVGAYTSPHISTYNERISLNGVHASDAEICAAFAAINNARQEISLSYFEFGTLAALYLFNEAQIDFWVLEVGLGGRLDAVNIIDADIAVITRIDIDHTDWLGDDRETIGAEKAGICRPRQKVVVADYDPPKSISNVFESLECNAEFIGRDFDLKAVTNGGWQYSSSINQIVLNRLELSSASVAAGIKVVELLNPKYLQLPEWLESISQLSLLGRFDCRQWNKRTIIFDVAHNPAALDFLAKRISRTFPGEKCVLILGMMKDKNIRDSIASLIEVADDFKLVNLPSSSRAASAEDLLRDLQSVAGDAVQAKIFDSVKAAMDEDVHSASLQPILVCGSFITVAEGLRALSEHSAR